MAEMRVLFIRKAEVTDSTMVPLLENFHNGCESSRFEQCSGRLLCVSALLRVNWVGRITVTWAACTSAIGGSSEWITDAYLTQNTNKTPCSRPLLTLQRIYSQEGKQLCYICESLYRMSATSVFSAAGSSASTPSTFR